MHRSFAAVAALSFALAATSSHAGVLSLLSKAGRAGKLASGGSKLARAAKLARVGRAAAGVTALVAAERAGVAFARVGDDVARGAAYVARGASGEVVLVTKAGQSTHTAQTLGPALAELGEGRTVTVLLDAKALPPGDALAAIPPTANVGLVDELGTTAVRRSEAGGSRSLLVDTAEGAVDLADLASLGAESSDDDGEDRAPLVITLLIVGGVLLGWRLLRGAREPS